MNDSNNQATPVKRLPLVETIQARYGLEPITQVSPLSGGEWKTLWRLDGAQRTYVASISHPTTTVESIAYEHRLLHYLHAQLPPVPAPLLANDGSSYFVDAGRLVCLLPLMPGTMADGAAVRLPAARFLAHFHRVGVNYPDHAPRPGVPAWREWDWCAAGWPLIEAALSSTQATNSAVGQRFWAAGGAWATQIIERRSQIREERSYFQQWLADLARGGRALTSGLVHDDYHDNNLLVEGEQVTALLDWDGCHPDWLLLDLSNAVWEFCHDDEAHTLDTAATQAFLQAYGQAGGPVTAHEVDLIIPLIRCRRMIEVIWSLRGMATGSAWDESPDYLVHNLIALENLRGLQL